MANEPNKKSQLTDELKRKIQDSVKNSFEKNVGGKGGAENAGIKELEKRITDDYRESDREGKENYESVKRRGEEKIRNEAKDFEKRTLDRKDRYLQKHGVAGDLNELRKIDSASRRSEANQEEQIKEIRKEAKQEAEKETERMSKNIKSAKGRLVMRLAGRNLDRLAFVISQKMAKQAKAGGAGAILVIGITYLFALAKDLLDFTGIGAIAGILTGILVGAIIGMFWVQVVGGWKGGLAQKILIKKIIVKIGIAAFIETLPGPNFIPTFIIMNLWSHLDYIWAKGKAKRDLKDFNGEYKANKAIIKSYYGKYIGS